MFHDLPAPIAEQMAALEAIDAHDRTDGTPRLARLRQVPPDTGRFLALMAAMAPPGAMVELGTSAGYSALWLALACRERSRTLTTFELLPEKAALARETFRRAAVEDVVRLVEGDALAHLASFADVGFCFLDVEKEIYSACYDMVVPRLAHGGILIADNAISHRATLAPMIERALADARVDAVVLPIGNGELVCRKR